MPFRFLEDIATADVAFEASGTSLEELFTAAVDAAMNVMVHDLADIVPCIEIPLHLEHEDLDLLLFNLLQEIVFYKDARNLLLRVKSIEVGTKEGGWQLDAVCAGENLDPERHKLIVDVKAVTLHRFSVEETETGWKATVILDI